MPISSFERKNRVNPPYQPRRAKRWLEGAPHYILAVFDNKGETADRYTVMIYDKDSDYHHPYYRASAAEVRIVTVNMSDNPGAPNGVSQVTELDGRQAADFRWNFRHDRINWSDLPADLRAHVVSRYED